MSPQPLLCITVTADTTAELRRRRDAALEADIVELRLDSVSDPDVAAALAGRRQPVIVTCRAAWEGGEFQGSEEERRRLLAEALDLGAEYVDIEWKARFDDLLASTSGRRIVLSFHDFAGVPANLDGIAAAMAQTGAEIIKIAVQAHRLSDCLPLLTLSRALGSPQRKVLIAMGSAGLVTRVLAHRFGSAWSYAGTLSGAGQVTSDTLLAEYRFRLTSNDSELYGLTGGAIGHSVSPAMHNAAFHASRLDAVYLPLPAADPDDFLTFAAGMDLKGASVTIPYKVVLAQRVDERDALAEQVGAINTLRIRDGRCAGANSDVRGFLAPLEARGVPLVGTRASILGAGGSARAVAIALASAGAEVSVHARDPRSAAPVASLASGRVGTWPPSPGTWDLLVNCTPVGMHPDRTSTPVSGSSLTGRCVYDLIYNPQQTELLRLAASAGCETIGGLDMLVAQAQEQFAWWTGIRPATEIMRSAAEKRLSEFNTP